MIIDCQSCPVRDVHCEDCMVTTLLAPHPGELPLPTHHGELPLPTHHGELPLPTHHGELPLPPRPGELPLDSTERTAMARFVAAGLVSPQEAGAAWARRDPWSAHIRAVG